MEQAKVPKKRPNKEENRSVKQKRKEGKIGGNKQDKTQNKTNRRDMSKSEKRKASDEKKNVVCAWAVCFLSWKWFFNELLLYTTKIFYMRRCGRGEEKKTFFRPHKKFSHGIFFSFEGLIRQWWPLTLNSILKVFILSHEWYLYSLFMAPESVSFILEEHSHCLRLLDF